MAFKLKSALKFGQKGVFKPRTYNSPNKQNSPVKQNAVADPDIANPKTKGEHTTPSEKKHRMLKEWLMTKKGFNQEDADHMIKDGAYSYKDMLKDITANVEGLDETRHEEIMEMEHDVPAEPKGNQDISQEDWEPAYEGGDHSWDELEEMGSDEIQKRWPDVAEHILKDLEERAKNKKQYKQEGEALDKINTPKSSPNKQGKEEEKRARRSEKIARRIEKKKKGTGEIMDAEENKRMNESKRKYIEKKKAKTKSPLEQEGPLLPTNIDLLPSEMEGTWVYRGEDLHERFNDYEDRIEFIKEDIWNQDDVPTDQQSKDLKILEHKRDMIHQRLRNTPNKMKSPNKQKESPNKMDPTMIAMIAKKAGGAKGKEDEKESLLSPMPQNSPNKQGFIWDEEAQKQADQMQGFSESDKEYKKRMRKMVKEGDMERKDFRKKKKQIRKSKRQDRKSERKAKKFTKKINKIVKKATKSIPVVTAARTKKAMADIVEKGWPKISKAAGKGSKAIKEARRVPKPVKSPPKFWQKEEYQENWKGNETPEQTLKAYQKDLTQAKAAGDSEMVRKIQMDIKSAKKEIKSSPGKIYDKSGKRRKNYKY